MTSLLYSLKIAIVVIDGVVPYPDASEKELEVFSLMQQDGMIVLNMAVKERIMDTVTFVDPHLVWRHLKSVFYHDSLYNFTVQMHNVHSLFDKVDIAKPLTQHIERFEDEHGKLLNLLKNSKNPIYSSQYYDLLCQDVIKKDMLLSALVPHNPMLVDTIMNNQQLTYEDSKNRLIAMPSSQFKEGFVNGNENGNGGNGNGGVSNGSSFYPDLEVEKVMVANAAAERTSHSKSKSKQSHKVTTNRPTCHFCHKVGHKEADCWHKQRKDKKDKKRKRDNSECEDSDKTDNSECEDSEA